MRDIEIAELMGPEGITWLRLQTDEGLLSPFFT